MVGILAISRSRVDLSIGGFTLQYAAGGGLFLFWRFSVLPPQGGAPPAAPTGLVLTEIDACALSRYRHLEPGDRCFYLREYTPRAGFGHGETNELIWDLKKSPVWRGTSLWRWKERAVERLARELAEAFPGSWLTRATLVPIPPSRVRGDPLYDDRMLNVLWLLPRYAPHEGAGRPDIRELVVQTASTRSASRSEHRLSPEEIAAVYRIDEAVASPPPRAIGLFDDVLATGAHFRAAKELLARRFPRAEVRGFFFARCVP
jgi:hypothetical protein